MSDQIENIDIILSVASTLLAFFVLLVTIAVFMYLSRKKIIEQQIKMQKEVLNAAINTQEQERSRISRDLHDDISSKLNAVSMNIYLLGQENLSYSDRTEIADSTFQACQLLIESTRRISHDLMPPTLDNVGLHVAIEEVCQEFSRSGMVNIIYQNLPGQDFFQHFTKEKEIHLFRITQELINNSIRHGNASEIKITFADKNGMKSMIYTDNGKGISAKQLNNNKGIGLKNIFSRSDILQAKAYIDTKYEKGFYFTLTL